jgi:hypothetical protein
MSPQSKPGYIDAIYGRYKAAILDELNSERIPRRLQRGKREYKINIFLNPVYTGLRGDSILYRLYIP